MDNERGEDNRHNRFLITPQMYMACDKYARQAELSIIGCYHSHPDAEARPSQYDIDHAWPTISYIIVSVSQGSAENLSSWLLREDRSTFDEEDIILRTPSNFEDPGE